MLSIAATIDALRKGEATVGCPLKVIRAKDGSLQGGVFDVAQYTIADWHLGSCMLYPTDLAGIYEIGFSLLPSARGKGLVTAAASVLIKGYAAGILHAHEIQAVRVAPGARWLISSGSEGG
jgi:hypothetical protein